MQSSLTFLAEDQTYLRQDPQAITPSSRGNPSSQSTRWTWGIPRLQGKALKEPSITPPELPAPTPTGPEGTPRA